MEGEKIEKHPKRGMLLKHVQAAVLGASMGSAPVPFTTPTVEAATIQSEEKKFEMTEQNLDFLIQNVYHEAKGESPQGQLAVAQVTLGRLASGKFGGTLHDVIFQWRQFSWTIDPRILMKPIPDAEYQKVKENLLPHLKKNAPLKTTVESLSRVTGLPTNTYYYKRRDWDEFNPEEKRMTEKTKQVFKTLNFVKEIGNHFFYTEPTKVKKQSTLKTKQ